MAILANPRIFLCHSYADSALATRLADDLRRAFGSETAVWYDTQGGLEQGSERWTQVVSQLTASDTFILLLSPEALGAAWVMSETTLAVQQGKRIVQALVRPCQPRPDLAMTPLVSFLAPNAYESALRELVRVLGGELGAQAAPFAGGGAAPGMIDEHTGVALPSPLYAQSPTQPPAQPAAFAPQPASSTPPPTPPSTPPPAPPFSESHWGGVGPAGQAPGVRATQSGGRLRWIATTVLVAVIVIALSGVGIYARALASRGAGGNGGGGSPKGTATVLQPTATMTPLTTNKHFILGTDFPTSGAEAAVGLPAQDGVNLAVSQNADLGNGNTLTVLNLNDAGAFGADPSIGRSNVQQLVGNPDVVGIVGPFNSGVAIAEIPVVTNAGIVEISPSNTNPGLTVAQYAVSYGINFNALHPAGKPEAYFRIPGNDVAQAKVDAQVALGAPISAHSVYVVDDMTTYGKGLATYFTANFTAGGGSVFGHSTVTVGSDFAALANSIARQHPDVVFYGGVTSDGGAILKKDLSLDGYRGPMLGGDGITDDPAWLQAASGAATNTYGTIAGPDPSALTSTAGQAFLSAYKQMFPGAQVSSYSAMAYDAAMTEITAIKSLLASNTPVTRAAIRGAVASAQYDGVTGHIAFDANGDNTASVFSVYEVSAEGQWTYQSQVVV